MVTPAISAPRRVLMTTDTVGGVWTYSMDLCRGLIAEGIDVILATMGAPVNPTQRKEADALGHRLRLCESRFKLEWMEDPWRDVAEAGRWLLALELAHRPDLIHLNGYAHAALPFHAPVVVVAHSCVFSWWRAVKNAAPPAEWTAYRRAVRSGLKRAQLVIAPSRAMLAELGRHYGAPARSCVIYNGRDAGPDPVDWAAKEPFVLSVGRLWDEAKNASALADLAPRLPWPVHLAGDTRSPDGDEVRLPGVKLLGHRAPATLQDDYRRAAIYALPARYEPFGLSVLEAALAGCALVLGDIPSLREIWGSTARYVRPDDPAALQEALVDLIAHPSCRELLAEAARERALTLTTARMTSAYLAAYARVLAPAPAPAAAPAKTAPAASLSFA